MKISISELIRKTGQTVFKDKIIFAPALISYFISYLLVKASKIDLEKLGNIKDLNLDSATILYLLPIPFFHLVFFSATIVMAISLYKDKAISIPESFVSVFKKLPHILVGLLTIVLPLFGALFFVDTLGDLPKMLNAAILLGIVGLILIAVLILEFIPIVIFVENRRWFGSVFRSIQFFKQNFSGSIILLCLIINIRIVGGFLSAIFSGIPVFGKSVFSVFFNGTAECIFYSMCVVFYFLATQPKPKVDLQR